MADGAVRRLTAVFGANTSGFKKGSNEIKAELTELNTAMYKNKKAQKEVDAELKALEKQEKELKKAINSVSQPTQEMIRDYENLKKKTDELTLKKSKLKTEEQELRQKIKNTNKELDEASKKADKTGLSFEKMGSMLKKVTTLAATGMIGLFTYAQKMASAADDINTLAKQTGLSTDEIQKFQYAAELIDVDIEVLTGSMAKLVRNMSSAKDGTGQAYEAFQALGISIQDSSGNLRNNQDVFNEAVEALSKIEEETQRDAYAMAIFGRSAQELNPLILGGTKQLKEFGDELERNGLILSQSELDKLNEFNDKIDTFKAKFQANMMKNSGELTEAFDELLDSSDEIIELISMLIKGGAKIAGIIVDNKEAILALISVIATLKITMNIADTVSSAVKMIKSFKEATEGATAAQTALNAVKTAGPYIAIAGGLTMAITSITALVKDQTKTVDEGAKKFNDLIGTTEQLKQSIIEATSAAELEAEMLKSKGEKYEELRQKINRTATEEELLHSIATEMEEKYAGQIDLIDEKTGAYKELGNQAEITAKQLVESAEREAAAAAMQEIIKTKRASEARMAVIRAQLESNSHVSSIYEQEDGRIKSRIDGVFEVEDSDDTTWGDIVLWFDYQRNIADLTAEYNGLNSELNATEAAISELTSKYGDLYTQELLLSKSKGEENEIGKNLLTTLGELEAKYNLLQSAESEYNETKELSQQILSNIISKYPELKSEVDSYLAGLISEEELLSKLSKAYQVDSDNYSKAVLAKNINTTEFYNTLIKNSNTYINELANQYGIDLNNYKKLNDAKLAIQKKFLSVNAKNWEKYYNAEKDSFTISDRDLMQYKKELMQAGYSSTQANSMVNVYKMERQQAIQAVNAWKAISSKLDDSLNNLGGLYKPTFSNSTNISGGSGGSNGGSGSVGGSSSGKNTDSVYDKALAAYKKLVDDRIALIQKWTDAEKAAADKRIAAIDAEIEARKKLKEDADITKQINAVKAQLKYSKLDNFSRMELERQLKSLEREKEETLWLRAKESQKQAIKDESDDYINEWNEIIEKIRANEKNATEIFTDLENGYKSTQTIVNNNSTTANIKIVTQGLTAGQVEQKIKDKLGMELIT